MRTRTRAGLRRVGVLCVVATAASLSASSGAGAAPVVCPGGAVTHSIAQVQGTGAMTPLAGSTVTVRGVVTADLRTGGHASLHVQTAGSGGAGRTVGAGVASDGIVVFLGADPAGHPAVAVGDVVQVTGVAGERGSVTTITTATAGATLVCTATGAVGATPLSLPLGAAARESLEGMLVAPTGTFTVSGVEETGRSGAVVLAAGTVPAVAPTDRFEPGSVEAVEQRTANAERRLLLDDGSTTDLAGAGQAPPYVSPAAPLRVGDRVAAFGATVLTYGEGDWRLLPTRPVTAATPASAKASFTHTSPRPVAPAAVGGDVKVATFDLGGYFVHVGADPRAARDEAALLRQEAKLVAAISRLDADIVALQGIENSVRFPGGDGAALRRLVGALNAIDGAGVWDWVRTSPDLPPPAEQDVTTNAFIYKPAAVALDGTARSLDDEGIWHDAREPIVQVFRSGDVTFAVVGNHPTSRDATPPSSGDNADRGDGQGAFNGDRVRQAHALVRFVDFVRDVTETDDVLLVGNFESHTQEDPMQVLFGAGYADVAVARSSTRSSVVVGGEVGSLDHVLASSSMLGRITGHDRWQINAHEAPAFGYDGPVAFRSADPFRSSDHNPEIIGIETGANPTASGARYVPIEPCRLFDTRPGPAMAPSTSADFRVRGPGTASCAIPAGATAASFTVHAVAPPAGAGYVRLGAPGAPGGGTTVVNHSGGFRSVSNTVTMPVPAGETLQLRNLRSYTAVVVDLQGYFVPEGPTADGTLFVPLAGCRLGSTRLSGGSQATVRVGGRCTVPADAAAVELSVSTDRGTVPAGRPNVYARVGGSVPTTTFLNAVAGEAATNTGPVGLAGGDVRIRGFGPSTTYVLDVRGYYVRPAAVPPGATGLRYEPTATCRPHDSRRVAGAPPATTTIDVVARCGLPPTTRGVHVALSVVDPPVAGFVRLYPVPGDRPPVTLLSQEARRSVTNGGSVAVGADGVGLWGPKRPETVLDVVGVWTAPSA